MPQTQAVVSDYLEKLRNECHEKQLAIMQARRPAVVDDLQAEPPEIQIAFLRTVLATAGALAPGYPGVVEAALTAILPKLLSSRLTEQRFNWLEFRTLGGVVSCLLRRKLPFQPEDLADMVRSYTQNMQQIHYCFPLASLISAVESGARTAEIEAAMRGLKGSLVHLREATTPKRIEGCWKGSTITSNRKRKNSFPWAGHGVLWSLLNWKAKQNRIEAVGPVSLFIA